MRAAAVTERPPLELAFDANAVAQVGLGWSDAALLAPRSGLPDNPGGY
jgi:hypothetical protein